MKLIRTITASAILALTTLSAAPLPARAYDPSASQNWSAEAAKRRQIYNNIKPYNYNQNNARKRVNKGPVKTRKYGNSRRKKVPKKTYSKKSKNAKGQDCTPYNGPDGYYGNPWCEGGFVLP